VKLPYKAREILDKIYSFMHWAFYLELNFLFTTPNANEMEINETGKQKKRVKRDKILKN